MHRELNFTMVLIIAIVFLAGCNRGLSKFDFGHRASSEATIKELSGIHKAIDNHDLQTLNSLLTSDADVINAQDASGMTPLHYAVEADSTDAVNQILAQRADVNIKDNQGDTALHMATASGNMTIIRSLLASGSDQNVSDEYGCTPADYAIEYGHSGVGKLLSEGRGLAPANTPHIPQRVLNEFYSAFLRHDIQIMSSLLKSYPQLANLRDIQGETPLLNVAAEHYIRISSAPNSPLEGTAYSIPGNNATSLKIAELLISNGANVNQAVGGSAPLPDAIRVGNSKLAEMLIDKGAWTDVRTYFNVPNQSPLGIAAYKGDLDVAKDLLEHGADVNAMDAQHWTPLLNALGGYNDDKTDMAKLLIDNGADVNVKDKNGLTPLHYAAMNSFDPGLPSLLVSHGADINAKSDDGRTALSIAQKTGFGDNVVQYLKEHSAK